MSNSKYESLQGDALQSHLDGYLVNSWSYSSVSCFARNEKEYERRYVYCESDRSSPNTVAGSAYHYALESFFKGIMAGEESLTLIDLEQIAYSFIDDWPANKWRTGKKEPSIEECKSSACKSVTFLLESFWKEKDIYFEGTTEVLGVEVRLEEWLTVSGEDIPLPVHMVIDLIMRAEDGSVVIIDHKTRTSYTDEAALSLCFGKQAITYVLGYEKEHPGETVSQVRFIECKRSKNKDGSPQMKRHTIIMDNDTRVLYEWMLYEPLRRLINAVSDPDYIFTVNDADNLADKAEIYDFMTRTLILDTAEFTTIPEAKRKQISHRQKKIRDAVGVTVSPSVITNFRKNAASFISMNYSMTNMTPEEKIEHVLRNFGIITRVAHSIDGYSSTSYLLEISAGVKIGNIYSYSMDIANALDVPSVRMTSDLVVYEGKSYLGIEVGHKRTESLMWDESYLDGRKIPLGLNNFRQTVVWDLDNHSTPHMLVCGASGSGKSVLLRSTLAYAELIGFKEIFILDPKYEFRDFSDKHVVINDIDEIEALMKRLVGCMQDNARTGKKANTLIIFDEFADALDQSRKGKDLDIIQYYQTATGVKKKEVVGRDKSLEENLKMLAQKGRSIGYNIIAATQRASAKIITGDTKVNFPVQVCFRMPKAVDSKVVLDEAGAECLAGQGDGLIRSPEYNSAVRFQGFWKP